MRFSGEGCLYFWFLQILQFLRCCTIWNLCNIGIKTFMLVLLVLVNITFFKILCNFQQIALLTIFSDHIHQKSIHTSFIAANATFLGTNRFPSFFCLTSACRGVHAPGKEVWSSHQTRMTKTSRSLSKSFLACFCSDKNKTIKRSETAPCLCASYLQAIKLNKENNSSLVLTLANYFLSD